MKSIKFNTKHMFEIQYNATYLFFMFIWISMFLLLVTGNKMF